jgi:phospholipid/cholesterol/gamma-HCH transport system permease protein
VRASLIVVVSVTLLVSLAIYGTSGNFNLSGWEEWHEQQGV